MILNDVILYSPLAGAYFAAFVPVRESAQRNDRGLEQRQSPKSALPTIQLFEARFFVACPSRCCNRFWLPNTQSSSLPSTSSGATSNAFRARSRHRRKRPPGCPAKQHLACQAVR